MEILETNLAVHPHCQDLLKDTVFGPPSTQTDSSSRLLRVPNFLPQDVADKWYSELKEVMKTHGAVISRSKDSPDIDYAGYQYKTAQFMNCPCMYEYAGTAKHKAYQLCGFGADPGPQVLFWQIGSQNRSVLAEDRSTFGKLGPKIIRSWPRTGQLLANWVPE